MRKPYYLFPLVFCFLLVNVSAQHQSGIDSTGLPGDNFSLQGALQMFQKAGSPEEFEKLINSESNSVNNLDLDANGETDFIRVIDRTADDIHAFVLQVAVSETESQDIAVIELEKTGDTTAIVQIIGDEDIFGEELIVEPGDGGDEQSFINYYNGGLAHGPSPVWAIDYSRIVVNVWFWPSVRFVYGPAYRPWISPWRWRHHPAWWKLWRPLTWHRWHPRHIHHHRGFAVVHTHRVTRAHAIYRPTRVSSVSVRTRHATAVGNYKVNRTRTTVTGARGNKVTRKSTTVKGPRGKVKSSKTTVKRKRH